MLPPPEAERMTRDIEAEIQRMVDTPAFRLMVEGQQDRILDTDFFTFIGCTVRTDRYDFLGRLNTVREAIETSRQAKAAKS